VPVFIALCLLNHFFDEKIYTRFQDNPTNNLVSGIWSKICRPTEWRMYGHGFHIWRTVFYLLIRNLYVCKTKFQATFLSNSRLTSMWHCIKFLLLDWRILYSLVKRTPDLLPQHVHLIIDVLRKTTGIVCFINKATGTKYVTLK